jgi:hypothetical protein
MEDNYNELQPETFKTRPVSLTILCVLTFISTGVSSLGCLLIPLMSDFMIMVIKQNTEMDPQASADAIMVISAGWGYYLTVLVFTLLSLTGAVYMWNLKKNGFHFYTIANIILFNIPIVWLGLPFNALPALLSLMFIGFYALHLKYMY